MKETSVQRENLAHTRPGMLTSVRVYFSRHGQALFFSLGRMWRAPLAMFMTSAVIGIALALPTGLEVVLKNVQDVSQSWGGVAQISLFLKQGVSDARANDLAERLKRMPEVAEVTYISRQQALEEFKSLSGFGEALKALDENPLPAVLVVHPSLNNSQDHALQTLLDRMRNMQDVDVAQLDEQWIKRLYAIMQIIRRGLSVLAIMLGMAVLLVVGNTIRLAIQNRRDEIVVIKLIGGTDAFIRRPFLYTGFWYGLIGGVLAWLLVSMALLYLSEPVSRLAGLYQSQFELQGMSLDTTLFLIGISILLGLAGSWLAVGRHLRAIEPR